VFLHRGGLPAGCQAGGHTSQSTRHGFVLCELRACLLQAGLCDGLKMRQTCMMRLMVRAATALLGVILALLGAVVGLAVIALTVPLTLVGAVGGGIGLVVLLIAVLGVVFVVMVPIGLLVVPLATLAAVVWALFVRRGSPRWRKRIKVHWR